MQALVKTGRGRGLLELCDLPMPQAGPGEVLVRVRACGICGSDLRIQDDQHPYSPPVVLGHEFAGEVVALGPAVTGWSEGDRVVSEQHFGACGRCRLCLTGNAFACAHKRAPGYGSDGGFAGFVRVPAWLLHRIPEGLSFIEAALTEPAAVAVHGVLERARVLPEDMVLVLGCGPIGLVAARMAQSAGASSVAIAGVGRDERVRLPKARELGIDHVVNVEQNDLAGLVMSLTAGEGADLVVELSGSPAAVAQGFSLARRIGRVCVLGQPPSDHIEVPYREALFKALEVRFSYSSTHSSWERALSLFSRGAVRPAQIVTHVLPLEEWERGFDLTRSAEAVKVVLEPAV